MLTAFALGFEGPGEGAGATLVIFQRKWMCREGDSLYVATQPVNSDGVEPRCLMPRRGEEKCAQDHAYGSRRPLSSLCDLS